MKTAILFYSYTGNTRKWAQQRAQKEQADLIEVHELKKRSTLNAYVIGSLAARRCKPAQIQPVTKDLTVYDKLIIAVPIWAGYPATPFHNMVSLLPKGKEVELVMVSGSGNSKGSAEKSKEFIRQARCRLSGYHDVKM